MQIKTISKGILSTALAATLGISFGTRRTARLRASV